MVAEIQAHSKPIIEHAFRKFLLQNHDPENREYADDTDQIREVLIHANYLSQKDVEICLGFDIGTLAEQPDYPAIMALHDSLAANYSAEAD